mmetsp:Transcript_6852/g.9463  ORF Transcript_6852/g.9463 Transcript_6852/m.9463 type:complete len:1010 (+) Transcript_6852:166-3195(+)
MLRVQVRFGKAASRLSSRYLPAAELCATDLYRSNSKLPNMAIQTIFSNGGYCGRREWTPVICGSVPGAARLFSGSSNTRNQNHNRQRNEKKTKTNNGNHQAMEHRSVKNIMESLSAANKKNQSKRSQDHLNKLISSIKPPQARQGAKAPTIGTAGKGKSSNTTSTTGSSVDSLFGILGRKRRGTSTNDDKAETKPTAGTLSPATESQKEAGKPGWASLFIKNLNSQKGSGSLGTRLGEKGNSGSNIDLTGVFKNTNLGKRSEWREEERASRGEHPASGDKNKEGENDVRRRDDFSAITTTAGSSSSGRSISDSLLEGISDETHEDYDSYDEQPEQHFFDLHGSHSEIKFRKVVKEESRSSREISKEERACVVPEMMTLRDLSRWTKLSMAELNKVIVQHLGQQKLEPSEYLSAETAELIGIELGIEITDGAKLSGYNRLPTVAPKNRSGLSRRGPIVSIMGHVNHGKTSLLDALRNTNRAEKEPGGITQGLGAFTVTTGSGGMVCFLDTPGHSVFHGMRSKATRATDIVVLIVSATDGVQEQTKESANLALELELPIIVAINKCDVDGADADAVKGSLMEQCGIVVEDLGGDTICVETSAKTGVGLDDLLDAIEIQAETDQIVADPKAKGEFLVFESRFERGKGLVLDSIVRWGTVKVGDYFVCGKEYGRVKKLFDADGRTVKKAGPSTPVSLFGLRGEECFGDEGLCVENEKTAKKIVEFRSDKEAYESIWDTKIKQQEEHRKRMAAKASQPKSSLEKKKKGRPSSPVHDVTLADVENGDSGGRRTLNVVLRADCHGSIEAISNYLNMLPTNQLHVNVLKTGIGPVTASDLEAASMFGDSQCLLFNVKATAAVQKEANRLGVTLTSHSVIYDLMDQVRDSLSAMLPSVEKKKVLGGAELIQALNLSGSGRKTLVAAGVKVRSGQLVRKANWVVLREGEEIFHAQEAESIRHFKDSVETMAKGEECGVLLSGFDDYKAGDVLQCYEMVEERNEFNDSAARRQGRLAITS